MYKKALELINNSHYILIVTHLNPDADTISSALSLSNYFSENKIKHKVFNKMKILPRNLDFLSNYSKITDQLPKFYDLIIYIDCANKKRIGIGLPLEIPVINIDHHQSNDNFGTINIVDDKKASCAEVIYEFFKETSFHISKQTAQCLYVGIYDDSLAFTTPRCNSGTFDKVNHLVELGASPNYIANKLLRRDSLAKYRILPLVMSSLELHFEGKVATIYVKDKWLKQSGATYNECEEFVNMVLRIGIVDIAIFLRYSNSSVRVSLRSKNNVDVSKIAANFNGGGHKMAAGCTCDTDDIEEAKEQILQFLKDNKPNEL